MEALIYCDMSRDPGWREDELGGTGRGTTGRCGANRLVGRFTQRAEVEIDAAVAHTEERVAATARVQPR